MSENIAGLVAELGEEHDYGCDHHIGKACGCPRQRAATALTTLAAENARLRETAAPFVRHWQPWMDGTDLSDDGTYNHPDNRETSTFARVTFGQVRALRAALSPVQPVGESGRG